MMSEAMKHSDLHTETHIMMTHAQIKDELTANPSFLSILEAAVFGYSADIDEVVEWAVNNWGEFAGMAGLDTEPVKPAKTSRTAITREHSSSLKSRLVATLPVESLTVRKRGKYSLEVSCLGSPDERVSGSLLSCGCSIVKTEAGRYGTLPDLLYVVTL